MLVIKARMSVEAGQMFIKAIEAACEESPNGRNPSKRFRRNAEL